MKKVILSALFVTAFSMGLFAKGNVDVPAAAKAALEVSITPETPQLIEEDDECINTWIPICDGGTVVAWMAAVVCGDDPYALLQSLEC